jgi:hypothetical protein
MNRDPNPGGTDQPAAPQGRQNVDGLPRREAMTQLPAEPVGAPVQPDQHQLSGSFASNAAKRLPATAQAHLPERHLSGIKAAGGRTERRAGQ